jgi:aminopeptidase N
MAPTDFTVNSGSPRAEQLAVTFEKVDLALRVDPASKSIRGDATLTFLLKEPLTRIAVELDRNLPVDSASVDGVRWRRRHQQSRRPPLPDLPRRCRPAPAPPCASSTTACR